MRRKTVYSSKKDKKVKRKKAASKPKPRRLKSAVLESHPDYKHFCSACEL